MSIFLPKLTVIELLLVAELKAIFVSKAPIINWLVTLYHNVLFVQVWLLYQTEEYGVLRHRQRKTS